MTGTLLVQAQDIVKRRLCGNSLPVQLFSNLQSAETDIYNLLKRTVEYAESNSLLIIGPKSCGKSTLIKKVVSRVKKNENAAKNLLVVNLNGYMQTDDRIALDEITRQLQLENTIGDKVFGSFAETLSFLLQALRTGSNESQPILFLLEEFDLFAQHKNQTLLYNLFDIAQAGLTPLAVIGVTCRIDVMELLEKRVKSRFSHRQIFICNTWTFKEYVGAFKDCLQIKVEEKKKKAKWKIFLAKWNKNIDMLSEDLTVLEILEKQFLISQGLSGLQKLLMYPVWLLSNQHPLITPADIEESAKSLFADSKANILHGVSVLELCLIISMNHLMIIHDNQPFNFHMVYNEFLKFSQKKSHILHNYSKAVVLKAFEHLIELELLKTRDHSGIGISKIQKEYQPMVLLVENSQLLEAIGKYPGCPTDVKQWAQSSIV
ncbi:unnamed protein product [Clavelina lepadiformis]|uniref:Origin recognition complex subunit 4 n=1 Tax=Clavelina lepadiformis TaxID=159417 RepID=A0ABP0F8B4_CLALP